MACDGSFERTLPAMACDGRFVRSLRILQRSGASARDAGWERERAGNRASLRQWRAGMREASLGAGRRRVGRRSQGVSSQAGRGRAGVVAAAGRQKEGMGRRCGRERDEGGVVAAAGREKEGRKNRGRGFEGREGGREGGRGASARGALGGRGRGERQHGFPAPLPTPDNEMTDGRGWIGGAFCNFYSVAGGVVFKRTADCIDSSDEISEKTNG